MGLFTSLGLPFAKSPPEGAALAVGDVAPEFELPASDGQTYRLSALLAAGRFVVLAWFPRAFTPVCTIECKSLGSAGEALEKFDVVLLAASVDPVERNQKFANLLGLSFPLLSDPQRVAARAYGVVADDRAWAKRWTFYIGRDGKIRHIDRQVPLRAYGQSVADTLDRLGAPRR